MHTEKLISALFVKLLYIGVFFVAICLTALSFKLLNDDKHINAKFSFINLQNKVVDINKNPIFFRKIFNQSEIKSKFSYQPEFGYSLALQSSACLNNLRINNQEIHSGKDTGCGSKNLIIINDSLLANSPEQQNSLEAKVTLNSSLAILRVPNLWLSCLALFLATFAVTTLSAHALKLTCKIRINLQIFIILFFSVLIRFIYQDATIYTDRQHDAHGHLQYILSILDNNSIPYYDHGWQSYQPPLYHFIAAGWLHLIELLDLKTVNYFDKLECLSFSISILYIISAFALSSEIFRNRSYNFIGYLFVFLTANYPGVILLSTKTGNDGLAALFSVLGFLLVIKYWRKPGYHKIFLCAASCALGLLTKSTALIPSLACLLVIIARQKSVHSFKISQVLFFIFVIIIIYGWFPYQRMFKEGQPHIVGNLYRNPADLFTSKDSILTYFIYNPVKVMNIVYASTRGDATRREYVLEYYVKSSLFSEFWWPSKLKILSQSMLLLLNFILVLLLYLVYRCIRDTRLSNALPHVILFICTIACLIAVRINVAIPGLADFRYTTFVVPAVFAIIFLKLNLLPKSLRYFSLSVLSLFALIIFIWFVSVWFTETHYFN